MLLFKNLTQNTLYVNYRLFLKKHSTLAFSSLHSSGTLHPPATTARYIPDTGLPCGARIGGSGAGKSLFKDWFAMSTELVNKAA